MSLFNRPTRKRRPPQRPSVLGVAMNARAVAPSAASSGLPAGALLVFGGLSLLVIGWGIWLALAWMVESLFTRNPAFTLRVVEAERGVALSPEMIREWSGLKPGEDNLFAISLEEVRLRLERNPIIRRAVVRRELPDRVHIRVVERVPVARVGQTEGRMNWLVDGEGIIINRSFESKHLPFLLGVTDNLRLGADISGGRARHALAYINRLREMPAMKRELLDVRVISVGHPDYLDWRLADGTQVLLPRDADPRAMLERASRQIYEVRILNKPIRVHDLRPEGGSSIGSPE